MSSKTTVTDGTVVSAERARPEIGRTLFGFAVNPNGTNGASTRQVQVNENTLHKLRAAWRRVEIRYLGHNTTDPAEMLELAMLMGEL